MIKGTHFDTQRPGPLPGRRPARERRARVPHFWVKKRWITPALFTHLLLFSFHPLASPFSAQWTTPNTFEEVLDDCWITCEPMSPEHIYSQLNSELGESCAEAASLLQIRFCLVIMQWVANDAPRVSPPLEGIHYKSYLEGDLVVLAGSGGWQWAIFLGTLPYNGFISATAICGVMAAWALVDIVLEAIRLLALALTFR